MSIRDSADGDYAKSESAIGANSDRLKGAKRALRGTDGRANVGRYFGRLEFAANTSSKRSMIAV
jgi:hypothetical protein